MAKQQMQRSAKSRQRPRTARLRDHRSEQGEPMSIRQPRAIWVEQCDAARDIRDCYGLSAPSAVDEGVKQIARPAAEQAKVEQGVHRAFASGRAAGAAGRARQALAADQTANCVIAITVIAMRLR